MRRVKRGEAEQTIVDLTDNRKLIVMVSTSKARQIIYNPNNGTYNPDFSKEPMVLTPELYITGSSTNVIATAETVKWYVRPNTLGQRIPIVNNDTYSIGNDFKLTISKNIMKDMLTMEFILEVIYKEPDSDFRTTIPHHMELINISMGEDGRNGVDGLDGLDGEMGLPGPKGKDGESSYTHLAYANDETGTQDFSLSDSNRSYIGMYVDNIEKDSDNPSDYKWTKVEGMPGDKGIQGPKGKDGQTPWFHIAYATNDTGTKGFSVSDSVGKTYIGQYTDYIEKDSDNPSDYSWTLIKGEQGPRGLQGLQGPQGDQGLKGPKGLDSYTHIAYATNETGTSGFSTSDPVDKLYIGMYVDNTKADSDNPSDYKWTKARGDDGTDGADGIPGKPGADGRTPYFHTAYANSEDGVTGFSTTVSKDKLYLGHYTNYDKVDPTDPGLYAWTLIKGEDGKDGVAGKNGVGVSNTDITYAKSTNGTKAPSTGYTPSVPPLTKGNYLWTKTVWTYTDNTTETGYSVSYIAKDGNDGSNGIAGKDGVGIKTTTITYTKSTSGTVKPTTGYTPTIPKVDSGQYLWTKTTWTYTDNTTEDGYSVAKMGETGSSGPRGLPGLQGPQGNQGVQGPKGLDSYTHIAYSISPTGATGFSTSDSTNKTYIGMYVDNTKGDSDNPKDYEWTLIKGADGSQGIPGPEGLGGITPYFHTAYANSSDGTIDFSVEDSSDKKYIGQYTSYARTGKGRNLVRRVGEVVGYQDTDGTTKYFKDLRLSEHLIDVEPNTDYIVSNSSDVGQLWRLSWFNKDEQQIQFDLRDSRSPSFNPVFRSPNNASKLRVSYPNSKEVKLEKGSESTPYSIAPEDAMQDSTNHEDYSWTKIKGETGARGADSGTLAIITPEGNVFRDTTDSLKLESKLFIGGKEVTASAYKWYYSDGNKQVTHATTQTATFKSELVKSALPIFLDATYNGTTYIASITLTDISDVYTSIILGVATFKNGKGSNTYTVKLYRNGEEIDPGGSIYSYEWEKLNSQGVRDTKFTKTGKTITINASDIDNTNLFNCYIYTK